MTFNKGSALTQELDIVKLHCIYHPLLYFQNTVYINARGGIYRAHTLPNETQQSDVRAVVRVNSIEHNH